MLLLLLLLFRANLEPNFFWLSNFLNALLSTAAKLGVKEHKEGPHPDFLSTETNPNQTTFSIVREPPPPSSKLLGGGKRSTYLVWTEKSHFLLHQLSLQEAFSLFRPCWKLVYTAVITTAAMNHFGAQVFSDPNRARRGIHAYHSPPEI